MTAPLEIHPSKLKKKPVKKNLSPITKTQSSGAAGGGRRRARGGRSIGVVEQMNKGRVFFNKASRIWSITSRLEFRRRPGSGLCYWTVIGRV